MSAIQNSMSPDTAALTTAAPEILAALKNLVHMVEEFLPDHLRHVTLEEFEAYTRAKEAIAKAEGTA